jgi:hypothetical protein
MNDMESACFDKQASEMQVRHDRTVTMEFVNDRERGMAE